MLCQAIVDGGAEYVRTWLENPTNDANARDWTGRTPLQLAAMHSTLEIVQLLIDHGARLVARLVDGRTALHLAAMRGSLDIVSALLRKSEANEEAEDQKADACRGARQGEGARGDTEMKDAVTSRAHAAPDSAG
jgi:ankyrin repeat protein